MYYLHYLRKFTVYVTMSFITTEFVRAQVQIESIIISPHGLDSDVIDYRHNSYGDYNYLYRTVKALSSDASVAGIRHEDSLYEGSEGGANYRAVLWSGINWSEETDLGTLRQDNSGLAQINALSADGTIAGGGAVYGNQDFDFHAVIWRSSDNWKTWSKQDLGDLTSGNNGRSWVNALSADGTIAGGASSTLRREHAVIWSGANWSVKTDLGTLRNDNTGDSRVFALSADGSVAGGWAETEPAAGQTIELYHASIWSGINWSVKTDLGTLRNDNTGESRVSALSADGSIAGGWADGETLYKYSVSSGEGDLMDRQSFDRAVIWKSSDNWVTWSKQDLGTLKSDNSGNARVNALSANGKIAGGWAHADASDSDYVAVIWSGPDWSQKTNLGTLRGDNSGYSAVTALSADGTIAGGFADADKDYSSRPVLWRLKYTNEEGSGAPVVVASIDEQNTRASIAKLANDRFAAMARQRLALWRLQDGCDIARPGQSCYSLGGGAAGIDGATDIYTEASFGHAFSGHLASGVTLANTFSGIGDLSGGLERKGTNPGAGVWTKWRETTRDGHWYLRGSATANRAKIKHTRSGFANIEPGTGTSTNTGWGVATELGRIHDLSPGNRAGYYGGLRHTHLRQSGYTETRAPGFPVSWSNATSRRTAAYAGVRYHRFFGDALRWSIQAELEQDLDHQDPRLRAQADGLGSQNYKSDFAHTRGTLSTELSYIFSDAAVVSLNPFVQHSVADKAVYGAMLRISGDF